MKTFFASKMTSETVKPSDETHIYNNFIDKSISMTKKATPLKNFRFFPLGKKTTNVFPVDSHRASRTDHYFLTNAVTGDFPLRLLCFLEPETTTFSTFLFTKPNIDVNCHPSISSLWTCLLVELHLMAWCFPLKPTTESIRASNEPHLH